MYHQNDHTAIKDASVIPFVISVQQPTRDTTANTYLMTSVNEAYGKVLILTSF